MSHTSSARLRSRFISIASTVIIAALLCTGITAVKASAATALELYAKVSRYCFGSTPYAQVEAGFSNPTSERVTYDVIFTQPDGVTMGTDRPTVAPGDTYAVSAEDLTMAGTYTFEARGDDGSYGSITFTSVKCMIVDVQSFGATPSTIKGSIGNGSITLEVANVNRLSDSPVKFTVFAEDNPSNKKVITVDPRVPENIVLDKLGYTGEDVIVHAVYEEDGKERDEVFTFDPIKFKAITPPAPKPVKAYVNCPEPIRVSGYKARTIKCAVTNKSKAIESYTVKQTGKNTASYAVRDVKPGATANFYAKVTVGKHRFSVTNKAGTSYDDIVAYWASPDAWITSVSKGTFCVHTNWPAPNKIYWEDGKLKKGKWKYGKNRYLTRKGGEGTYCGNGQNVSLGGQNKIRITSKRSGQKKDVEVLDFNRRAKS